MGNIFARPLLIIIRSTNLQGIIFDILKIFSIFIKSFFQSILDIMFIQSSTNCDFILILHLRTIRHQFQQCHISKQTIFSRFYIHFILIQKIRIKKKNSLTYCLQSYHISFHISILQLWFKLLFFFLANVTVQQCTVLVCASKSSGSAGFIKLKYHRIQTKISKILLWPLPNIKRKKY